MNAPLALRSTARLARARPGSGIALQTGAGNVSAFFTLEGFDRRRVVVSYTLRVVNNTKSALICRTWLVARNGDSIFACPGLFEILPSSTTTTQFSIFPREVGPFDRAVAEIAGAGVQCIVDAPSPAIKKAQASYAVLAAASLIIGFLAIAATTAMRGAVPRIEAFAVPPMALAGTTVQAEYSALGTGKLSYFVLTPDGRRLQGGPLAEHSGSIPVAIPVSHESGAYTLQMAMQGPLGSAKEVRVLNAVMPPTIGGAQISNLTVKPAVAKPGQPIEVSYAANGEQGYVRLQGSDGTIWAQQAFARNGETRFLAPPVSGTHAMRVLLHVDQGRSTAESMAGFVVADTAEAASSDSNLPAIAGDNDPGLAATDSNANGTFEVLNHAVKSGNPIHVRILSPRNGMRISLDDLASHEVTGADVGADDDSVSLRAPAVNVATRYTVVASFTDGFGQESIVQPVTILP
jgi:hypothetical protein